MPVHIKKIIEHPIEVQIRKNYDIRQYNFLWLAEHLLPAMPDKFKGCEIIFPDTVFFKAGKPKLIVRCDKDFCLTSMRNPEKLKLPAIQKDFANIFRERKRDLNGVFSLMYKKQFQIEAINKLNQEAKNPANEKPPMRRQTTQMAP